MSKVDQVNSIFLRVYCSGLSSFLTVIQHDLVVIAAATKRKIQRETLEALPIKIIIDENGISDTLDKSLLGALRLYLADFYLISFSPFDEKSIEFILSWFSRKTFATLKLLVVASVSFIVDYPHAQPIDSELI